MADQPSELRRIDLKAAFPFTNIFRTFKISIYPSVLAIGLCGLVLTGLWGRLLDGIWNVSDELPRTGELDTYWQTADIDAWRESRITWEKSELIDFRRGIRTEMGDPAGSDWVNAQEEIYDNDPSKYKSDAVKELEEYYDSEVGKIEERIKADESIKPEDKEKEIHKAHTELGGRVDTMYRKLEKMGGQGIFGTFLEYETELVRQLLDAARVLNFTGALNEVMNARDPDQQITIQSGPEGIGVLPSIFLMLRGVQWLVAEHWLYTLVFGLGTLAIWAIFAGGICRMAALNFAREERLPAKQALMFGARKFVGFFTAPLMPVGLVLIIGLCLWVGGLALSIPWFGDIVGGFLMFAALIGGCIMAFVAVGALGAGGLMWPTIAVEGSDGFDAMSRSYTYVLARPWRAAFYAAVATVYGAICYLFLRFALLVVFKLTRLFVGSGASCAGTPRPGTGIPDASKIDAIWPNPSFDELWAMGPAPFTLDMNDRISQFFIIVYTLILVGLLCSFLVTFFLSGSTIIYCLLRQHVDATDLEDVYVEEEVEEFASGVAPMPTETSGETPSETSESSEESGGQAPPEEKPDDDQPPG